MEANESSENPWLWPPGEAIKKHGFGRWLLRMILVLAVLASATMTVVLFSISATRDIPTEAEREATASAARVQRILTLVNETTYVKDARTGFCFGYVWSGAANGGPAIAHVPCDEVPPNLLHTLPE